MSQNKPSNNDSVDHPSSAPQGQSDVQSLDPKETVMDEPVDALRQSSKNPKSGDAPQAAQASDSTPGKSTKPPKPPTPGGAVRSAGSGGSGGSSGSSSLWLAVSLILVLLVVALALGMWWQKQRIDAVTLEVASRLQQSEQNVAQVTERATQAAGLVERQRDAVEQLNRELTLTRQELRTLQQAWEAANEGLDQTLLINDLQRLITLANQELALFGNVNSAISILSSLQPMLKAQTTPALKALYQAIVTDLSRLHTVPQVDVSGLSARLDSLIELTGKAPLLAPESHIASLAPAARQAGRTPKPSDTQTPTEVPEGWWAGTKHTVTEWGSEAWSVLAREFNDVMSIRKADDPQALLLSEEQAIQLRSNMRAMLLSAQLALMTRQTEIWRSELTQVQSLLNSRFDTQALDTKAALNLLTELLNAPVSVDVPAISDTLSALASAQRVVSIPVDPGEVAPEDADPSDGDQDDQDESTQGT